MYILMQRWDSTQLYNLTSVLISIALKGNIIPKPQAYIIFYYIIFYYQKSETHTKTIKTKN